MVELFANSGDPDQMLSVVSDLGLHCLPATCLVFNWLMLQLLNSIVFTV